MRLPPGQHTAGLLEPGRRHRRNQLHRELRPTRRRQRLTIALNGPGDPLGAHQTETAGWYWKTCRAHRHRCHHHLNAASQASHASRTATAHAARTDPGRGAGTGSAAAIGYTRYELPYSRSYGGPNARLTVGACCRAMPGGLNLWYLFLVIPLGILLRRCRSAVADYGR